MTGGLQDLLAVQDLDLSSDQLHHRRSHLPERAELAGLAERSAAARWELDQIEKSRQALAERQAVTEAELAVTEGRAATINRRLFGGEVSASKDLQAMSAEMDQLKGRASALEDAVLEIMEEREPLDARAGEIEAQIAAMAGERSGLEERLAVAEAAIDAELSALVGRRREAAAAVPEGLLATYERLRGRLGGVGVARLVGNHCDGCHLTLSAAELEQVRHLGEGQVYQCEQCSRILVP